MTYKSLLLHLDAGPDQESQEQFALKLAARFEAHLTGLALAVEPGAVAYGFHPLMVEAVNVLKGTAIEEAKANAEHFRKTAARAQKDVECRIECCFPEACPDVINLHARYCDLVIMGQSNPKAPSSCGDHLPEHVVLSCGRPILVAPHSHAVTDPGKRITVAWDASQPAMRAVSDALPFLKEAEAIEVLTVNAETGADGHGEEPGSDISLFLTRHGCQVELRSIHASDGEVGTAILSSLADFDTDLLVMGAYGHWRLGELILGGVTQKILSDTRVPVLLAH